MTETKDQYEQKLKSVGAKLKNLRYTIRGTLGLQEQPYRERILETIGSRQRQTQNGKTQQGTPQQGIPQVQEKFMNRPRLLDFLSPPQSQEPQEPQLREDQIAILREHEAQMIEDAEKRALAEEQKLKEVEKQETLKRARRKMSFANI